MTATLADAWSGLVSALAGAGFEVVDDTPPNLEPPIIILAADDPYIVPGDTFTAEYTATVHVSIIFEPVEDGLHVAANTAIAAVLGALPDDWLLEPQRGVSAPFRATDAGGRPAVRITVFNVVSTES